MLIPVKSEYEEKFESLGFGKGVFWVIGRIEKPGACSNCGHKLKYQFIVKSSDDKTFPVGSECLKEIASDSEWVDLTYHKFWDDLEERPPIKKCKYCGNKILFVDNHRGRFYPVDYEDEHGIGYISKDRSSTHAHHCQERDEYLKTKLGLRYVNVGTRGCVRAL